MKRRKFIVSSGAALGGASAIIGLSQKPAEALDFTLSKYDKSEYSVSDLENISSVEIEFNTFKMSTEYLNTGNPLEIKLELDIEDRGGPITSASKTYTTSFTNREQDFASDSNTDIFYDTTAIEATGVGSNINIDHYDKYKFITLKCTIKATVSHPDLDSDLSKSQEFYISEEGTPHGLYDVVTRYGEKSALFNDYEKRILEESKYEEHNLDGGGEETHEGGTPDPLTKNDTIKLEYGDITSLNEVIYDPDNSNRDVTSDFSIDDSSNGKLKYTESSEGLSSVDGDNDLIIDYTSENNGKIFELDDVDKDGDDIRYLEGLLSLHVASTSGFVTSSKKMEAIERDSNNERVARESYVNGDGPDGGPPNTYSYGDDNRDGSPDTDNPTYNGKEDYFGAYYDKEYNADGTLDFQIGVGDR